MCGLKCPLQVFDNLKFCKGLEMQIIKAFEPRSELSLRLTEETSVTETAVPATFVQPTSFPKIGPFEIPQSRWRKR